jgi:RNA polymerase-binding transcription factor DksA
MKTLPREQALAVMLDEVTRDLKEVGIHNPDNENDWIAVPGETADDPDMIDVADAGEEWEERASTLALLETRWNNIRRALKKIDQGTYGTCEICSNPIEDARLDANPSARTCIAHREDESILPL